MFEWSVLTEMETWVVVNEPAFDVHSLNRLRLPYLDYRH